MKPRLRNGLGMVLAATVAAGFAFGASPAQADKGKNESSRHERGPRQSRDDERDSRGWGRPTLQGTLTADYRGERTINVQDGRTVYRVNLAGADIHGLRSRATRRGTRVLVWGRTNGRTIDARRVQVLGANQGSPGYPGTYRPGDGPRYDDNDRYDRYGRSLQGRVTRTSSPLSSRDITVDVDGVEVRVEVPKEARITRAGEAISIHDIGSGEYVRLYGERLEEGRFRADRIEASGDEDRDRDRPGEYGRDTVTYTGSIRDRDTGNDSFRMRLNAFETYTVRTDRSTRFVRGGRSASFGALRDGMRVRVRGQVDTRGRILHAETVELL